MLTAERATPPDTRLLGQRVIGRRLSERTGTDRRDAVQLQEDLNDAEGVVFGRGDRFRYSHRTLRDLNIELVSSAATTDRSGDLHGGTWLALGWTASGGVHIDDGSARFVTDPGVPVVFPVDRPFSIVTPAGVHHLVRIDLGFIETVDAVLSGARTATDPVFRTQPRPDALQGLQTSIHAVATAAFGESDPLQARLSLQVQLAEWVVRAYGGRSERRELGAGRTTVELAQAYLAEHCGDQVTLADLCRATGVSARTLQSAFLRYTDSTPMTYLQHMRLDRVRIALQLADPGSVTVATVAREWGFRHMGRFAGTYLQRFGEYPGETLRGLPTRRLRSRALPRTA
ncbi:MULTISPECIES: AraC family transcriptional regulator [unclassified Curtobacterium]|uniref:AraC family transcriptional regulator n=1 Tax=unclassified Curtobacterium TaxID=257496 RepID=UPI00226BB991|nr:MULTISPECIES: helix-turn-helix domain-containing protein [unclassified Curtobacterium]